MDEKNLMPEATQSTNLITIQNLPTEFAELSDKDLQQIVGGGEPATAPIQEKRGWIKAGMVKAPSRAVSTF